MGGPSRTAQAFRRLVPCLRERRPPSRYSRWASAAGGTPTSTYFRAPLARMEFQPWVGGRTIDHGTDGTTCAWTRILAYEPPHRVVFSWDITTTWEIETDPAKTSEVEITFDALHTGPHPGRVDPPPPRPPRRRLGRHSRRRVIGMEPRRAPHNPRSRPAAATDHRRPDTGPPR